MANSLYESICRSLHENVVGLHPVRGYYRIRSIAVEIASLETLDKKESKPSILEVVPIRRRSSNAKELLNKAYRQYQAGDKKEAFDSAQTLLNLEEILLDTKSKIDALHIMGRVRQDSKEFDVALEIFDKAMDLSHENKYYPGFVRAVHESSRIWLEKFKLLKAEAGLRLSLDYYAYILACGHLDGVEIPGGEINFGNLTAAINCLRDLAMMWSVFLDGPREAYEFLDSINSRLINPRSESGFQFLDVRALSVWGIATCPENQKYVDALRQKEIILKKEYPELSLLAAEEALFLESTVKGIMLG